MTAPTPEYQDDNSPHHAEIVWLEIERERKANMARTVYEEYRSWGVLGKLRKAREVCDTEEAHLAMIAAEEEIKKLRLEIEGAWDDAFLCFERFFAHKAKILGSMSRSEHRRGNHDAGEGAVKTAAHWSYAADIAKKFRDQAKRTKFAPEPHYEEALP